MDDVEQKREKLKTLYSSESWDDKVDRMSPAQVIAVYLRHVNKGNLK